MTAAKKPARARKPKRVFTCPYCKTDYDNRLDEMVCATECVAKGQRLARMVSCWSCVGDVPTTGDDVGVCRSCGWVHPEIDRTNPNDPTKVVMIPTPKTTVRERSEWSVEQISLTKK